MILPILSTRVHSPGRLCTSKMKEKSHPDNEFTGFCRPRDRPVNTSYHLLTAWTSQPGCALLFPWAGNPINTGVHALRPTSNQDPNRATKGVSPRVYKCQRVLTQKFLPAGPRFPYIVLKINRPTIYSCRNLARSLHYTPPIQSAELHPAPTCSHQRGG